MRLNIYVPCDSQNPPLSIRPGSAIVGKPTERDGRVVVYYEGNLYGADNLKDFNERVKCAAGRCANRYPTVAFGSVETAKLRRIGEIETDGWQVSLDLGLEAEAALQGWLESVDR